VSRLRWGRSERGVAGAVRPRLAAIALCAALGVTAGACSGQAPLSARDRKWQQDIDYLARELPTVRSDGLGTVSPRAWHAAVERLKTRVPQLTDGQVIAGLGQLVAKLHDDETLVQFPPGRFLPVDAQWIGGGLYLLAVLPANRGLLGARLLAVDGHPVARVLARVGTTVDAQDPQLRSNTETGALDDLGLLHSLGITASATSAVLTVQTRAGKRVAVRIPATGTGFVTWPYSLADQEPELAHVPLPLYRQDATRPYWLRVLPGRRAVYLKYNQCLHGSGFQRLAAQALALLRAHRDYRLVVDLRDNGGGDSGPFQSLITGLLADRWLRGPGRVIGLVNEFTDSSATVDAESLKQAGALLIGQPPADPVDEWGNIQTFRLPRSRLLIEYTTATINGTGTLWGIPNMVIKPTLAQILAGKDPVLAAALSYHSGTG
jgi:hypothetical protein